mmetsp:Transcript_9178/g.8080  ORF Transcript_9178/g.8080 Transcript_9178/m.8080 type:complete len:293 (+) Transcript_9178:674-1552(+)
MSRRSASTYGDEKVDLERFFVYFVSRIGIVYNPNHNKQKFYQGHKYKITCQASHPSRLIIATGESAPSPSIHIWNILTLEPLKIVKTDHKNGILTMSFSHDGVLLASCGFDKFFSIQVTNWKTNEILGFRNSDSAPILELGFHSFDRYEFTSIGYNNVAVWKIDGKSLLRKDWIFINSPNLEGVMPYITCFSYINYQIGKNYQSDIIVGDNFGTVGLVSGGKYYPLKKEAHAAMINCIKVSDALGDKNVIITAGEDEFLKIWNINMELVHEVNLREQQVFSHGTSLQKNLSI